MVEGGPPVLTREAPARATITLSRPRHLNRLHRENLLALACDFRIGVPGMELRKSAAALGLHHHPNGLHRYVSRLGLQAAKRLFLLAQTVAADKLLRLGSLDALAEGAEGAEAGALDVAVECHAQALLQGAPLALQGMKQSLNDVARGCADPARVQQPVARCAASADLQEGLAALAARRPPRFTGR
jgi:enoyl-CoA hydratase/carnithine racemase